MSERAKVLLAKAADDLDLIKDNLSNDRQRDNVGYHISMALEKSLKALCEVNSIEYPRDGKNGHDLRFLFEMLVDNGISVVADFADLLVLEEFDSQSRYFYTADADAIDLKAAFNKTKELFSIVLRLMQKKGLL